MKRILLLAIFLGFSAWGANIAVIDSQRVFNNHPGAQKAKDTLNKMMQQKRQKLKSAEKEILALQDELEKPMSKKAKGKKEAAIRVKMEAFERSRQSAVFDIEKEKERLEERINKSIYIAIKVLANKKGIDFILEKRDVIYQKKPIDITDEIIKNIKKQNETQ